MERRPKVAELLEWLDEMVQWQNFGHLLPKMEPHYITVIEKEKSGDISNQKIALYNKWLSVCPEAKWSDVIGALERTSHIVLASKVKQKLGIK